jgi:pyridinium-3,5-biscarboxylic acid mononucleotide sulfurtransferase
MKTAKQASGPKLQRLIGILKRMQSVLLAYSGGVDSTFLLKALQLSGIRTLAVTADSEIIPHHEVLSAKKIAREFGITHKVIHLHVLSEEKFVRNTPDRCFVCKKMLFQTLSGIAASEGYQVMLDGSTADDAGDYRPGMKAAIKYHVRSPLTEAGFSKNEIREYSRQLGLQTWDKPSSPCLATRIPYGSIITGKALKRIDKSEAFLRSLGFREIRVREHGCIARIEAGKSEMDSMITAANRAIISNALKAFGYAYVSLDLDGYARGSLNRVLQSNRRSRRWIAPGI